MTTTWKTAYTWMALSIGCYFTTSMDSFKMAVVLSEGPERALQFGFTITWAIINKEKLIIFSAFHWNSPDASFLNWCSGIRFAGVSELSIQRWCNNQLWLPSFTVASIQPHHWENFIKRNLTHHVAAHLLGELHPLAGFLFYINF